MALWSDSVDIGTTYSCTIGFFFNESLEYKEDMQKFLNVSCNFYGGTISVIIILRLLYI